ncbi:hypothetical protein M0L20_16985 [Spirosoma sp. RP8]|uniref:HNH endonuclease n=1 Tax=Spirosoma liriopis TaxID=2937440 RepID=A0ABT0HN18_9BACT|nr:hypothetical protein [Spirosoma liriopis]MCK8493564.1 hypothetical protein [Spirosoma liriopis]
MSNKQKKQQQNRAVQDCIFCGSRPLTGEHFWSKWLKPLIDEHAKGKYVPNMHMFAYSEIENFGTNREREIKQPKKRTGPAESWQPKVVCSTCNNGWMSGIDDAAKPILSKLIIGDSINIGNEERAIISRWLYLKTIIGEFKSNNDKLITKAERYHFKETREVPEKWDFWLARVNPPDWARYHSQPLGGFRLTDFIKGRQVSYIHESTIFIIGELILFGATFPANSPGFPRGLTYSIIGDYERKMQRIHPDVSGFFGGLFRNKNWQDFEPLNWIERDQLKINSQTFVRVFLSVVSRHNDTF